MLLCPYCGRKLDTPFTKKCEGKNWGLYLADSRFLLPTFKPETFDAVITDPPYNSGGLSLRQRSKPSSKKYISSGSQYQKAPEIAFDGIPETEWEQLLLSVFKHSIRLLKPGGLIAVFTDWRRLEKMASLMAQAGLPPKGVVVWDKTAGSRPVKGGFNLQTEFILWGRKGSGAPELYAQGVVTAATLTKKQHITQKPVKVIEHLLKVVPKGGKVLDPFAGVATTGVATVKNGYHFVGVELVSEYFEIGCRRLKEIGGN